MLHASFVSSSIVQSHLLPHYNMVNMTATLPQVLEAMAMMRSGSMDKKVQAHRLLEEFQKSVCCCNEVDPAM